MPQHVVLSNGAKLDIPDGTPNDEITSRVNTANALIKMNVPNIIKGGKAWWDAANAVAAPAGRIAGAGVDLYPPIGAFDWGASGINALKAVASGQHPALNQVPDIPTVSGAATRLMGAPPMDQNAPGGQRYVESAVTGALSPQDRMMSVLRMLGSTGLGDLGESAANYFGGPDWAKLGRWFGSTVGSMPEKTVVDPVRSAVSGTLSGKQAPNVADAAANLNTQPSFGSLANPAGRQIENTLGSLPLINIPTNIAKARLDDAIQRARGASTEQINQGPLPSQVDPNSIGGNLITQARTKSAAIKADASQRFQNLYNNVPADTLVNARPVISAIEAQANSPTISAAQKQELLARRDYLVSMTYGQPGYNGPVFGGGATPVGAIPLGQLGRFKTELGADIQSMTGIDRTAAGPVYDAVDNAMQAAFNRLGYGPQYQAARDNYARSIGPGTVTDKLDAVGGTPVSGKPGIYEGGMNEGQAHGFLARNLQSPSALGPFVDATSPYWRATTSQFLDSLGQPQPGGSFDPGAFSKGMGKISGPVLDQLTQDPEIAARLRNAQTLAGAVSPAAAPHGFGPTFGGLIGAEAGITWLGEHFANAGVPAAAVLPAIIGLSMGMQSKPMTDAMAGQGTNTPLVDALYTGIPYAAASQNLNNPDDPRNQPVVAPRRLSPLDQLNNPPPQLPPQPAYSP